MKEIPKEAILSLINVGKTTDDFDTIVDLLQPIKSQDFINRLHNEKWKKVSQKLERTDLIALVKGLTLAEQLLGWAGGSVSAVIWTYQEVAKQDQETTHDLADWILQRTNNPYAPFGHQNHGAKSLAEYKELQQRHQNKINAGIHKEKESEKSAQHSRLERQGQRKKSAKDRNTEIRKTFINALDQKNTIEQLSQLAYDKEYSVEFYPTKMVNQATVDFLNDLDENLQLALLEKLKGRHKGQWGKVKRNLLEIYREKNGWGTTPWNRKPWFY